MKHSRFAGIVLVLVMLFLYLPIVVLVANSFNLSRYGGEWAGFTLDWYVKLFTQNQPIWEAFERSLLIAATATAASCVLGTTAALALHRWKDRLQTVHYGLFTIWIAHTTFCVSYVTMTVLARLQDFDDRVMEAAYDLGASPLYAFFKVELPILLPGIIAGGLLAFTLSIDDFVITFFVTGPGADTLPLKIYSMIKHSRQMPVINSLSTLMLAFTCVLVALSRLVANRRHHRPTGAKTLK